MLSKTLTAGQAAGITQIPSKTIQRYIRDFRPFFSSSCSQAARGRRFAEKDIKVLFAIRHLYFQRKTADEIRAALAGENSPLDWPQFTIMDDLAIHQATREHMATAQAAARKADLQVKRTESMIANADHVFTRFRQHIERGQVVNTYLERIERLEKEVAFLKSCVVEVDEQQRPQLQNDNLLARLFGL